MRRVTLCTMAAGLASLLVPPLSGQSQPPANEVTFTWLMPLANAVDWLQLRFGKVVTYEDPLREWAGETEPIPRNSKLTKLKRHSLTIPASVSSAAAGTTLTLEMVQLVVDAYHQQNPTGARFKATRSEWGFHIVPVQVRDASGALTPVNNPLDAQIEVPVGSRTAAEHLEALAKAAGAAAGIRVIDTSSYVDEYFGFNQYLGRMGGYLPEDRQYLLFEWGTKGVTAREALINLVSRSCSTFTWNEVCVPSADQEGGKGCLLGVIPLVTGEPPRARQSDRCTGMRMLPTPQTPRH